MARYGISYPIRPHIGRFIGAATITTPQTIVGKSRIQVTTSQLQTGRSRIAATTLQTVLGRGRIALITTQTILGRGRLATGALQTVLGRARVTITTLQTQLGKARIAGKTTQNQPGKARIQLTTLQTILGRANLLAAPYIFSRQSVAALPANNATLSTSYSSSETTTVTTPGNVTDVTLNSQNTYAIHEFKVYVAPAAQGQMIQVQWKGKFLRPTSNATAVLQIYNLTSALWENLATDSASGSNVLVTLNGTQSTGLTNYYDGTNYAYCRVYQ
jgi:hypothetical protein